MKYRARKYRGIIVMISLLLANAAYAFDMGNMMNPSKWVGSNRDDDDYDRHGYGYGGYGGPGWGVTLGATVMAPRAGGVTRATVMAPRVGGVTLGGMVTVLPVTAIRATEPAPRKAIRPHARSSNRKGL